MHEPLPQNPEISISLTMYYYDTDAGGVVHNIAYLRHIEEARTRLAEHLGWRLRDMAKGPIVPVVRRTEIDYLSPARLGDVLVIFGKLTCLATASFEVSFDAHLADSNRKILSCVQKMVCVRLPEMRPTRVPLAWREKWPHLAEKRMLS